MHSAPDSSRNVTTKELATQAFTDLHNAIFSHESDVSAGNVDAIHDMRVAVRRMRVALSNFASILNQDGRKLTYHKLSDLADKLGAVRDIDVFIAALEKRKSKLTAKQQTHISNFIRRLRARRRRQQQQLATYLQGADYHLLKHDFLLLIQIPSASINDGAQEMHG